MIEASEALACTCARIADERKAEKITVLHVGPIAFFTDYFVIATARNDRQIRAIVEALRQHMREAGVHVLGVEGAAGSGWVLMDLGDAVVHLFSPEARDLYDLELLWGEARRVDWQQSPGPLEAAPSEGRA